MEVLNWKVDVFNLEVADYTSGLYKKLYLMLSDNFSKVFTLHFNSFKGIFKNDIIENSPKFQAFVLATFRFFLLRILLWIFSIFNTKNLNKAVRLQSFDVSSLRTSFVVSKEFAEFAELVFLFSDLLELDLEFLDNVISNIRLFVLNPSKNITNFLYSSYVVYGKVPLLPEFHLVVMKTVLPYILRTSWRLIINNSTWLIQI